VCFDDKKGNSTDSGCDDNRPHCYVNGLRGWSDVLVNVVRTISAVNASTTRQVTVLIQAVMSISHSVCLLETGFMSVFNVSTTTQVTELIPAVMRPFHSVESRLLLTNSMHIVSNALTTRKATVQIQAVMRTRHTVVVMTFVTEFCD
jgi:hypothetical protein